MKKKINFKMILIVTLFILLIGQVTHAEHVYSVQKLNDGSTIKRCRFNNGKVDYCTQQDALKAMDVFNNPQKYMSASEKAEWNKKATVQEKALQLCPVHKQILESRNIFLNEAALYGQKANLGIDVDTNTRKSSINARKAQALYQLKDVSSEVLTKYENIIEAYNNKQISDSEYQQAINANNKLKSKVEQKYKLILSVNVNSTDNEVDNATKYFYLDENTNENASSIIENKLPETTKNKINKLKNMVNMTNGIINSF